MKRIVFLLMTIIWFLASCEGPAGKDGIDGLDGYNGRDGKDGKDGKDGAGAYWFVANYTINSNQWQLVNGEEAQLNSYYRFTISIPELNRDIYEKGNVFCYFYQILNGNREVQTPLPFTNHYGEVIGGKEYLWTETYSIDFYPGAIMFYITYSDFLTNNRPQTITFRVVLNY